MSRRKQHQVAVADKLNRRTDQKRRNVRLGWGQPEQLDQRGQRRKVRKRCRPASQDRLREAHRAPPWGIGERVTARSIYPIGREPGGKLCHNAPVTAQSDAADADGVGGSAAPTAPPSVDETLSAVAEIKDARQTILREIESASSVSATSSTSSSSRCLPVATVCLSVCRGLARRCFFLTLSEVLSLRFRASSLRRT